MNTKVSNLTHMEQIINAWHSSGILRIQEFVRRQCVFVFGRVNDFSFGRLLTFWLLIRVCRYERALARVCACVLWIYSVTFKCDYHIETRTNERKKIYAKTAVCCFRTGVQIATIKGNANKWEFKWKFFLRIRIEKMNWMLFKTFERFRPTRITWVAVLYLHVCKANAMAGLGKRWDRNEKNATESCWVWAMRMYEDKVVKHVKDEWRFWCEAANACITHIPKHTHTHEIYPVWMLSKVF